MTRTGTTVMLIDDHAILRNGLRRILEEHKYAVVGEAGNAEEARAVLQRIAPDVVMLDIGMPGVRGIEFAEEILDLRPDSKIIFLTVHKDEEYVYRALSLGASGYVLKDCVDTEIIDALKSVERGKRYLTPLISSEIVNAYAHKTIPSAFESLSVREREVLTLLCDGKSNKELASALSISTRTAEHHRQAIMKKLGVHSLADMIKIAIKHKLVEL